MYLGRFPCNPNVLEYISVGGNPFKYEEDIQSDAVQTIKHEIKYYTTRSMDVSKPYVACTFKFLIPTTSYLQLNHFGISLGELCGKMPIL